MDKDKLLRQRESDIAALRYENRQLREALKAAGAQRVLDHIPRTVTMSDGNAPDPERKES